MCIFVDGCFFPPAPVTGRVLATKCSILLVLSETVLVLVIEKQLKRTVQSSNTIVWMFTVSRSNTLLLRLRFPSQSTVCIAMLATSGMNDSMSRYLKSKLKRIVSMLTRMAIRFDGVGSHR